MASYISKKLWFLCFLVLAIAIILSIFFLKPKPIPSHPNFRVRGVNLGSWLVLEGWIKPSLINGIPNKDFLDGNTLQFQSVTTKKNLCAENGGGSIVGADCTSASSWGNFRLWRINATTFLFRVSNNQFLGLNKDNIVVAMRTSTDSERFEIIEESSTPLPNQPRRVRIKTLNGYFLQVKNEKEVTADASASNVNGWSDDDPTVFWLTIKRTIDGDFQVQNGYGHDEATKVMKEHYNSFIVEDDFKFIAKIGLNAVRIPVGWWASKDPYPPAPYVSGSLQALDNAFLWAKKYGLKIILDLHAAPGSQNSGAHSSPRDGTIEWGKTEETIQQTLDVIDFFTARYVKSESLYAIELLNEPLVPGVEVEVLIKYYKAAFEVVRKHSSTLYVVMSPRLNFYVHDTHWSMELFPVANSFTRSVIDVHFYSYYYCIFQNMITTQEYIDYTYTNRRSQLDFITANGPLSYVGEWSAKWYLSNATKEDYQQLTKAKIEVYNRATFGWTYWTYKIEEEALEESDDLKPWSFKWLYENGYLKL